MAHSNGQLRIFFAARYFGGHFALHDYGEKGEVR
jgi:hypothetical protein